jgi:geranylgeranyl pyrophosphate synthase
MVEKNSTISPKQRFYLMGKIHEDYFPLFLEICRCDDYTLEVKKMIEEFVIGRIGAQRGVRAFIFEQLYLLSGGTKNIDYLLAAIELQLASMYCFNVAADTKAGYDSPDKRIIAYQTQNKVFDLSLKAIDKFTSDPKLKKRIKEIFRDTQTKFQIGEVLDTIVNLYKNKGDYPEKILRKINKLSKGEIWDNFGLPKEVIISTISGLSNEPIADYTFPRTYGINAAMIENFGSVIGEILGLDREKILKLREYGKFYGLGMMIINDVQDYSLDLLAYNGKYATREKYASDVFNDIKKGKITWPIKFALEIDGQLDHLFQEKLGDEKISYADCDRIRNLLLKNGAIKRSVLEAAFYEKLANDCIKDFKNEKTKQALFQATTTMMRLSKYVIVLENKYKTILKPKKSEITKRLELGDIYS